MFFGNKEISNRFSSIFGERAIAGTYMLNFFFFGFIYFYFFKKNNYIAKFFFILLCSLGILLSFDRMPFILFLFFYFFICLLNLKKDPKLSLILIIVFVILIIFSQKYEKVSNRYSYLLTFEKKELMNIIQDQEKENLNYYSYSSIYNDALKTFFFENIFIGSGKSTFYFRCRDYRLKKDENSIIYKYAFACPNHTHNLYLEILIAGGILGFFIFFTAIILKFYLLVKSILQNTHHYTINSILLTAFIVEIFPFRSYGNIFSSYNAIFFFLKISIIYSLIKYKYFLNNKA